MARMARTRRLRSKVQRTTRRMKRMAAFSRKMVSLPMWYVRKWLANTLSVETGEEGETVEYTCRAKLYNYVASDPSKPESKKEWKERGLGTLRLNVKLPEASDDPEDVESGTSLSKPKARLVMRSDGSHRVILNTPVRKELSFGDVSGNEPKGQYVYFMGTVDVGEAGKLELLQLKMRHEFAVKLWEAVKSLQETM